MIYASDVIPRSLEEPEGVVEPWARPELHSCRPPLVRDLVVRLVEHFWALSGRASLVRGSVRVRERPTQPARARCASRAQTLL